MSLLPRREPAPPFLELVSAAQAAFSAIEGMRRSCSDEKRRQLFAAGDRLGVALGRMPADTVRVLPANVQERLHSVVGAVSEYSGLEACAILGRSRTEEMVAARDLVIYLLREDVGLGPAQIGRQVGRDHSSVLTALRRTERLTVIPGLSEVRAMLGGRPKGALTVEWPDGAA